MVEVIFVVELAIVLALVGALYVRTTVLNEDVLRLASEAKGREHNDCSNHHRLASALAELIDEITALQETLKTERVARISTEATSRVGDTRPAIVRAPPASDER